MYEFDFSKLKGKTIGVAVSGGKDSMCLLDIIADKSAEFGFDFVVVNVEHGIRGEISKRDSEFVRSYAISCGYEIMSFSVDCLDYAEQNGLSVETAARELR